MISRFYKTDDQQWNSGWFPTLLSSEMGIMGSSPALGKQFSIHFYFIIRILQFTCNFLSADLYYF